MTGSLKNFRDFGIGPVDLAEPPGAVRAVMSAGAAAGQYALTLLMSLVGLGLAAWFGLTAPFPANVAAAAGPAAFFAFVIHRATRNDYRWVELTVETLRAKHLYTGRVVERDVGEVVELLTLVFQVRTLTTVVTERWIGRVRGVMIRFADGRTPLLISRNDPTMRGARELIEAVLFRLSQRADLDVEVIDFAGKPLLRRVSVRGRV